MITRVFTGLALMATTLAALPARADDSHNHGAAPSAAAAPALPRFATSTELFELVGVVDGRQLTVYLDRFDDNTPVKGAKLELELGGTKVALKETADGEFHGTLAQAPATGITPVTATVTAGTDTDLIGTDLDVHANASAPHVHGRAWLKVLGGALGALVLIGALAWRGVRTRATRRVGGAA